MNRISPGTIIVGVFAVLFGLIGAYAVRQHLTAKPVVEAEEAPAPPPLLVVPMASTDIEAGRPLTMGDVAVLRLKREQIAQMKLPANYMTSPEQIIGRVLRDPVKQGDVFLTTGMYPENMLPTVAERLTSGLRAVTVPMQDNGLAAPGSVIDVIFRSTADPERQRPQATVTLLEGVEILAVGHNEFPGQRGESAATTTVTLAVSSEQASALKVVEGHGELHLAMRRPDDAQVSRSARPLTLDGLLGLATPTVYATEVYRGTKKTENSFATAKGGGLIMTQFPIGPGRTLSAENSTPEATAPTSLNNEASVPTSDKSTSLERRGQRVKRGLSGLPLLPAAEPLTEIEVAQSATNAGAK